MSGRPRYALTCPDCGRIRITGDRRGQRCRSCASRHTHSTQGPEWMRMMQSARWPTGVDEMAVERLISGSPVRSTRDERQAAVAQLTARGMSAETIAARLRISARTVTRLRALERTAA